MKKGFFNKSCLVIASTTMLMSGSAAYADNLFLLQLGVFSSQENAAKQFSKVESEHGNLLGNKQYILRKTRPLAGGDTSWRVLVGPFDNRRNASRSCAELKDKGADCFVVETAAVQPEEFENATQVMAQKDPVEESITDETNTEATTVSAAKNDSDSDSGSSLWNWLDGDSDTGAGDKAKIASSAAAEEESNNTSSDSGININTSSVYGAKARRQTAPIDTADISNAFSNLFGFGGDAAQEEVSAVASVVDSDAISLAEPAAPLVEEKIAAPTIEIVEEKTPEVPETPEVIGNTAAPVIEPTISTPIPTPTGEVEIAEAIPVPLTEPKDVPITMSEPMAPPPKKLDIKLPPKVVQPIVEPEKPAVATLAEVPAAPAPIMPAAKPAFEPIKEVPRYAEPPRQADVTNYRQDYQASRLLQISVFNSDNDAFACLTRLQSNVSGTNTLRTRIIKSTIGRAVLRLGPLNDTQLEAEICDAATSCGPDLRCRILTEQKPRGTKRITVESTNAPAPKDMSPRNATPAPAAAAAPAQQPASNPVWVQLGTSSSKSDAQSRFESLQNQYPTILGSYSPAISSPERQMLSGKVYRLRVGPFDQRDDAQKLCAKLSSHGVGCLILRK